MRALKYAMKKGMSMEDAEDFASWLTLQKLEGKSLSQELPYSFLDYCDIAFGNPATKPGQTMRAIVRYYKSTSPSETEIVNPYDDEHLLPDGIAPLHKAKDFLHLFIGKRRRIFQALFIEGLSQSEVAEELSISRRYVCQIVTQELLPRVREYLGPPRSATSTVVHK